MEPGLPTFASLCLPKFHEGGQREGQGKCGAPMEDAKLHTASLGGIAWVRQWHLFSQTMGQWSQILSLGVDPASAEQRKTLKEH